MSGRRSLERQITRYERSLRRTTYGQKGGDGPTQGRKASVYTTTDPTGKVVTVRSFKTHTDNAVIAFYFHRDCGNGHPEGWYPNGAWPADDLPEWVRDRYVGCDPSTGGLFRAERVRAGG